MPDLVPAMKLTLDGAMKVLAACLAKAKAMGVPQDIVITDEGGHLLAMARMDGAKVISIESATTKARTAASIKAPTGGTADEVHANRLALATGLRITNLKGGLPIIVDGHLVGAIGVGSGTGDQDVEVARAGLAAINAQMF